MSSDNNNKRRKTGKPKFQCIGCFDSIPNKQEALYCNFKDCENILCNICVESNDFSYRDAMFSECFSCICDHDNNNGENDINEINFYYCKEHSIQCKHKQSSMEEYKFCFASICKPCQMKDPNWSFKKCGKCSKYVCRNCILYCGAQNCENVYCSDCVEICGECHCKLCPITKQNVTISGELHVCFDDHITNLMRYIKNDIPNLDNLSNLLKELVNNENEVDLNLGWVESDDFFNEGHVFIHNEDDNDSEIKTEFTSLEEIKEMLNVLTEHKLANIIEKSNGNFSYFFAKIQSTLGSTKNILLLITQMLFIGEITIDERIVTISNEIIKQEEQLILASFNKECCSVLLNE